MEDLFDNLTAYFEFDEDETKWPDIGFEIDRVWLGRAEPDVGIMDRYIDDYTFDAWVGDRKFRNDTKAFALAICEAFGDITVLDSVHNLIKETLDEEAENYLD